VLPATGLRFTCRQVYRLRSIQQGSSESWLVSAHDASLLVNLVSAQVLSKGRDTYDTYPCESFRSTRGPLSPFAWDFSLKRKFLKRSFSPFSSRLLHYHHFRAHRFQFGCDSPLLRLHLPFFTMCDYTQVEYSCGHKRFTVKAWCIKYQQTQKRCLPNVIAM